MSQKLSYNVKPNVRNVLTTYTAQSKIVFAEARRFQKQHHVKRPTSSPARIVCYASARSAAICSALFLVSFSALVASSPASAQFACTTTATDSTCTNTGNATTFEDNIASGTNQNATTTNSGTAVGFAAVTTGGGNATGTNSGINTGQILAVTEGGGNATATNTGTNTANNTVGIEAATENGGNATATNPGNNAGNITAVTLNGGNATATNSGTNTGNVLAIATGVEGGNATASNSGSITDNGTLQARVLFGGNATARNTGFVSGGIAAVTEGGGNATATNSGNNQGGLAALTTRQSADASFNYLVGGDHRPRGYWHPQSDQQNLIEWEDELGTSCRLSQSRVLYRCRAFHGVQEAACLGRPG
jgi:hypothetical protein